MAPLSTYSNKALKQNIQHIREERAPGYRFLEEATTQFISGLEALEKKYYDSQESPDELSKELTKTIHVMNSVCEKFERFADYDRDTIKEAQANFRERTNQILSQSYFISRARTWPQGAQGDYNMLESIYRNSPLSQGIGYYLDQYCLNLSLANGVRNRIKNIEEVLKDELSVRNRPSVLNVACGSCRELVGLSEAIIDSKAKVICVDNDNDALNFAQDRLSYTAALSQIEFRKYNALRMFDHELNMMEFGMQDIIYSVGYFDYLADDFLVKMLNSLYMLINPGGKLIMAFKDASNYKSQDYHWLAEWDGFLQRTEDDFKKILGKAEIPGSALSQSRDESDTIIFYTASR